MWSPRRIRPVPPRPRERHQRQPTPRPRHQPPTRRRWPWRARRALADSPVASAPQAEAVAGAAPLIPPPALAPDEHPAPDADTPVVADAAPTATPAASSAPRRLVTSFAAMRGAGDTTSATQLRAMATGTSLLLGVPFHTQIDGTPYSLVNCGPASLSMVLTAFGLDADPAAIRDYLNYLVGNYDTEEGTSLYTLARIASEAGLNTFRSPDGGLQGWSIDAVREQVRAGHPVITLTKYRRLPGALRRRDRLRSLYRADRAGRR